MTVRLILIVIALLSLSIQSWSSPFDFFNFSSTCGTSPKIIADEPARLPNCQVQGRTMYIDGDISLIYLDELNIFFKDNNINHIELNSFGGKVNDAIKLAEYIFENKISTGVRENAVCKSACTLVYQAGIRRQAHSTAKFLYHTARISPEYYEGHLKKCLGYTKQQCENDFKSMVDKLLVDNITFFNSLEFYGLSEEMFDQLMAMTKYSDEKADDELKNGNLLLLPDIEKNAIETVKYNIVQVVFN